MLTTIFLDMNAYFASVEQQVRPSLRGRPVGIVATLTDYTCCIAASYEAKQMGVKTGTGVRDARKLCPGIKIIEARPELYVRYHHQIVEAVESCLHVDHVMSIDEMACRLMGTERAPENAIALGHKIKRTIKAQVGDYLRCSVGIAPNRLLAKVASDMQKPDGLTVIKLEDLPQKLYSLDLEDLPGIGKGMHARLERSGIKTVEALCALSKNQFVDIWQSVVGGQWFHELRGEDIITPPTQRRTVGHSHILPPALRHDEAAKAVLINLIHKAAVRLRHLGYWAAMMGVRVEHTGGEAVEDWEAKGALGHCQDTQTMIEIFNRLWKSKTPGKPFAVSMVLYKLTPEAGATLPLFPADRLRGQLARVMDSINTRFGKNTIYFSELHGVKAAAPTRISFTQIPDFDIH